MASKEGAQKIIKANTFMGRLKGLLGTNHLPSDTGLLLEPCNRIHTWGMKYAIDALFLDQDNQVVHLVVDLAPNKWGAGCSQAVKVLELQAGQVKTRGIEVGDVINLEKGRAEAQ